MVNMRSAASVTPGKLAELALLPATTETTVLTAASGTGIQLATATLTNVSVSSVTVSVSLVKAGGTAGTSNRSVYSVAIASNATLNLMSDTYLGSAAYLNDGDFISMQASAGSAIAVNLTGVTFLDTTSGVLTGIQDDFIGTGGHGTASVTGTNLIGANTNRYLIAALMVQENSASAGFSAYTTLTMSCTDGTMAKLASIDFTNSGGTVCGSVHLFGRPNPTPNSTQTLTANVAAAGGTMLLCMGSMSLYGVASTTAVTSAASGSGASTLSLPVTSATGHRPFFASLLFDTPQDIGANVHTRYFNGITSGFTVPKWLVMSDQLGASTVTATTSNSTQWAAVGLDLVPA